VKAAEISASVLGPFTVFYEGVSNKFKEVKIGGLSTVGSEGCGGLGDLAVGWIS